MLVKWRLTQPLKFVGEWSQRNNKGRYTASNLHFWLKQMKVMVQPLVSDFSASIYKSDSLTQQLPV